MTILETAFALECGDETLIGVLHSGAKTGAIGVLIVVGGPQYRVGSHRQFVLLARDLAHHGIPVLRFDYRGMGDSSGSICDFENVNDDLRVAVDAFFARCPTLRRVVIWGLCDAASAALFYAHRDSRIAGLVLLNPWVRTDAGMAKAYMKHYYLQRLLSADFWKKVVSGKFNVRSSLAGLGQLVAKLRGQRPASADVSAPTSEAPDLVARASHNEPLPERMAASWEKFSGPVLLILSGNNDFVADEFRDVARSARRWKKLLARRTVSRQDFPAANHTFSRHDWRDQVALWTREWLQRTLGEAH